MRAVGAAINAMAALEVVIALSANPVATALRGAWSTVGVIQVIRLLTAPV